MAIQDWSTTPASNTLLESISWAEGMSPSAVNNGVRAIAAAIKAGVANKGTDIASAGTIDLGAATGQFVDITGTTTITALGTVAAGTTRWVRFTGALTLTHNATSLILPGSASITTAANDRACFVSLGSGNWLCLIYAPAAGLARVNFSNTFTATQVFSAGATFGSTLTFTSGALNWLKAANLASAATTDIGAVLGNVVDVTGTTTITALGTVAAGTTRIVRFTGSLTLTNNNTSLILPGGANIQTATGDVAIFISLGSGNWYCAHYQPIANRPTFLDPSTKPSFRAYPSALTTSVANNTATKLTLNTESFDIGTYFDAATNYRWTPPAGKVRISARVNWTGVTQEQSRIDIYKNGSPVSLGLTAHSITDVLDANGTDYFEVFVTQTSGGSADYTGSTGTGTRACGEMV